LTVQVAEWKKACITLFGRSNDVMKIKHVICFLFRGESRILEESARPFVELLGKN